MKVSVLGAGAVGCMITGLIKRYNPTIDLWLYGRGEHAEAMRRSGTMELRGNWGASRVDVKVCDSISDIAGSDLVLLTVKSTSTDEVMAEAKPYIGKSVLVSLQNGINQHTLKHYLDPTRYFVGITATNMSIESPGVIALHLAGPTIIGPPAADGMNGHCDARTYKDPLLQSCVNLLSKSRLPMLIHLPIEAMQYNKISVNALGYISALSRSNFATQCLLDPRWRRKVAVPILTESARVMDAAGIQLAHVPGPSDVLRLRNAIKLLDLPIISCPISRLIRKRGTPRLIYSVEQDLLRGRPTEIDYVNGEIVRLGEQHGTAAPLHQLSVDIAHELETRPTDRFLDRDELIERFDALAFQERV